MQTTVLQVQHGKIHASRFADIHPTSSFDSVETAEREARSRIRWLTDSTREADGGAEQTPAGVRMLSITTTKCHDYGHPELTLALDSTSLEVDVRWFAGILEQMVQSGSRFQPGQSLQVGWSMAWFVGLPDKTLGFEEPDMKSMPLVRQPGLTNSLRHLRLHKDTLESVLGSDALSLPSLQQGCLICTRLARSGSFFMDRRQPQSADSGWFIGCQADEHDHNDATELRTVSLYEAAAIICPRALPYLAFPSGATIAVDEALSFFMDGEPLEVREGSFVDALRRQNIE